MKTESYSNKKSRQYRRDFVFSTCIIYTNAASDEMAVLYNLLMGQLASASFTQA